MGMRPQVLVVSEVLAGEHLGGKNDLTRMLSKVFDDGVDHLEDRLLLVLHHDLF